MEKLYTDDKMHMTDTITFGDGKSMTIEWPQTTTETCPELKNNLDFEVIIGDIDFENISHKDHEMGPTMVKFFDEMKSKMRESLRGVDQQTVQLEKRALKEIAQGEDEDEDDDEADTEQELKDWLKNYTVGDDVKFGPRPDQIKAYDWFVSKGWKTKYPLFW